MKLKGLRTRWRERRSDLRRLQRAGVVSVGAGTYGTPRILDFKYDPTKLTIGSYCSLGEGVTFVLGGGHPTNEVTTFPFRIKFNLPGAGSDSHPKSRGDIVVGSDVWIGAGATVLSGVVIGDGAVIGAGSVVSRDVPPFSIAVGNPAREVRRRFDQATVEAIIRIRWWEWPIEEIAANIDMISSDDIHRFLEKFDK